MTKRSDVSGYRAMRLIRARGSAITLRRVSVVDSGPEPLPNPARVSGLVVTGDHPAGTPLLSLTGSPLVGRFVPGDLIDLPGLGAFLVTAEAAAVGNSVTLTVAPTLPAPVADGTAATPIWTADLALKAIEADGGRKLPDGSMIEQHMAKLTVAALELGGQEPDPQWRVVLASGAERTIIDIEPVRLDGMAVTYDLLVR